MHRPNFPAFSTGRLKNAARFLQQHDLDDERRRHIIREISEHAEEKDLMKFILPHCKRRELDFELAQLFVSRRLWESCGNVLQGGDLTEEQRRCIIDNASKEASELGLHYILPHSTDDDVAIILPLLVARGMWYGVSMALDRKISDVQRRWAVLEASKHTDSCEFAVRILPRCTKSDLVSAVKQLITRGMWRDVHEILKYISHDVPQSVTDSATDTPVDIWTKDDHKYVIDQAIEKAPEDDFIHCVLPHCADDELDHVLTQLVARGLWYSVDKVLQRGVDDAKHRWAVEEAHKRADNTHICECILHHCPDDQVESVLKQQVVRGLWRSVGLVLQRRVSHELLKWVFEEAGKRAHDYEFCHYLLPHCPDDQLESVLKQAVEKDRWDSVEYILNRGVSETMHTWAVVEACERAHPKSFMIFIRSKCHRAHLDTIIPVLMKRGLWIAVSKFVMYATDAQITNIVNEVCKSGDERGMWEVAIASPKNYVIWIMFQAANRGHNSCVYALMTRLIGDDKTHSYMQFRELLITSLFDLLKDEELTPENSITGQKPTLSPTVTKIIEEIVEYAQFDSRLRCDESAQNEKVSTYQLKKWLNKLEQHHANQSFRNHFEYFLTCFASHRRDNFHYGMLFEILGIIPLFSTVQSIALGMLQKHNRWDAISQSCLSQVWEQIRRELLRAAVKQKQWHVVKIWADHTLYDDQRLWALEEAYKEKQWEIMLLLADYGLTDVELMRVHYRLARYADWNTVLQSFQRGADVAEVRELLERKLLERKTIPDRQELVQRCAKLRKLEQKLKYSKFSFKLAAKKGRWRIVFYRLPRDPDTQINCVSLDSALERKDWFVVMQLLRLGIGKDHRDALFSQMLQQLRWGVCRVLMEQGIAVDLCLAALPQFMKMNQWGLVARVMQYKVTDHVRHLTMRCAMEKREGSVVWQCMSTMKDRRPLQERESLFQRAFNLEIWQVIKPLTEENDRTGISHRDNALLKAIDKHQWDVVDHCRRHNADINMQNKRGETPLLKAAEQSDWEAVEELVCRDGDLSVVDRKGRGVLHRAIEAKQWGTVRMLIEFQGNLHQSDYLKRTPLQMLIDEHKGEHIDLALLWVPDLHKGVNYKRETPLHAVCASGWDQTIYYLVARGVDPLTVTYRGESALMYAVQNQDCPQKMVAECIKLGFSVHQPSITNTWCYKEGQLLQSQFTLIEICISPMEYAVLHNMPVVMRMLYESGSCLHAEILKLCDKLQMTPVKHLFIAYLDYMNKHVDIEENIDASLPYLKKIATTPRSLASTCRLVINRNLNVRGKRHKDMQCLPLPTSARNFIMFSDLSDPNFGKA